MFSLLPKFRFKFNAIVDDFLKLYFCFKLFYYVIFYKKDFIYSLIYLVDWMSSKYSLVFISYIYIFKSISNYFAMCLFFSSAILPSSSIIFKLIFYLNYYNFFNCENMFNIFISSYLFVNSYKTSFYSKICISFAFSIFFIYYLY